MLPAAAANVAIVRQAMTGALGVLGLGETRLLDINAAVSEACNNVVVHAYPDADGPMDVELAIGATEVEVTVSRPRSRHHPEQAGAGARRPGPRPVADPDAHRQGRVSRRCGPGNHGQDGLQPRRCRIRRNR